MKSDEIIMVLAGLAFFLTLLFVLAGASDAVCLPISTAGVAFAFSGLIAACK
jgi:hypothetical protein